MRVLVVRAGRPQGYTVEGFRSLGVGWFGVWEFGWLRLRFLKLVALGLSTWCSKLFQWDPRVCALEVWVLGTQFFVHGPGR